MWEEEVPDPAGSRSAQRLTGIERWPGNFSLVPRSMEKEPVRTASCAGSFLLNGHPACADRVTGLAGPGANIFETIDVGVVGGAVEDPTDAVDRFLQQDPYSRALGLGFGNEKRLAQERLKPLAAPVDLQL